MLFEQTINRMQAMKWGGMIVALEEQRQQSSITDLDFEERLGMLVERQWLWQESRALTRRLQRAHLKVQACLEDINYRHKRGLRRDSIEQMIGADWIRCNRTGIITGPTGTGKTYLACALGHQACRDGFGTLYYYAPKLFRDLRNAQLDGSLITLLRRLARMRLLIIDDWGMEKAQPHEYRSFLEIIDDRHGTGSTLITSQFHVDAWHDLIADATVADAILDRIVHSAYRIELSGPSLRDPKHGMKGQRQ
jgi:DNA replication protein DnaC